MDNPMEYIEQGMKDIEEAANGVMHSKRMVDDIDNQIMDVETTFESLNDVFMSNLLATFNFEKKDEDY